LRPPSPSFFRTDSAGSCLHRHWPPELLPHRRTPPPEESSTTSTLRHRSGEIHPRPYCPAPSLWPRQLIGITLPPASHHRAVNERTAVPSRVRAAHSDRAMNTPGARVPYHSAGHFSTGSGHQAEAQRAFRLATLDRPPRLVGCSPGPDQDRADLKIYFLMYLIPEILANFQNS
jgi:hypothetical protein